MRPPELSFRTRAASLEAMSRDVFDLVVLGGGITGAGIARDAALRGLRVCLLERRDFAVGTSSRSSKLIHGGLRYLQQGDVALVMEAANERRVLRRLAPHLARPIKMVMPVPGRSGYAKIRAGLWTFDRMARVPKDERNVMLGVEETRALEPLLRPEPVYGSGVYYECLTDDARLVLENLKAAAALGVHLANYTAASGFLSENGRLTAVIAHDTLSDRTFPIHGKVVVNAAGPWVDDVRLMQGAGERSRLHLTKGVHLIVRRDRLPLTNTIVMYARDKRPVFAIPRGNIVYIGTTDTSYHGVYDDPAVTVDDALYLLEAANRTFDVHELTLHDIVGAWAGLRPLLHEEGKAPSEISRKDEIMISDKGLISIAGGKLTTYRKMAERIVQLVVERLTELGEPAPTKSFGASEEVPLCGGDISEDIDAVVTQLRAKWPTVGGDIVKRLIHTYGSNGERMVEAMAADPRLGERVAPGSSVTRGEVEYGVREEMVLTLQDFLDRRARLFLWDVDNGLREAEGVAQLLAQRLGWSEARRLREVEEYRQYVATTLAFAREEIREEPKAAHG